MRISDWSSDVCSSDLTSRRSLRLLGTVGEPINPEAWRWYHHVVGEDRCPIIDTWWQQETGASTICGTTPETGRASCREGGCRSVEIWVVAVSLHKTLTHTTKRPLTTSKQKCS